MLCVSLKLTGYAGAKQVSHGD